MSKSVGRIEKEFLLTSLMDRSILVDVHGNRKEKKGFIVSYDDGVITLAASDADWGQFEEGENLRVFFSYYGNVMTFPSVVIGSGEIITIREPDRIFKKLARKYERIPAPDDMLIGFSLENRRVELSFPRTEEYNPAMPPEDTRDFDLSSIASLVGDFRLKSRKYALESQISMYRGKEPVSLLEKLVCQTGKILYVDQAGTIPDRDLLTGGKLITSSAVMLAFAHSEREKRDFETALDAESRRRSGPILLCPVIFHEYTVGTVSLFGSPGGGMNLDPGVFDFVSSFADILSYSLKMNGYFKGAEMPEALTGHILDVSASGLCFSYPTTELNIPMALYQDLTIQLSIQGRDLAIGSRIMRRYADDRMSYWGVQFMEIEPEDFRFLFDTLYGRNATCDDLELWEGGAAPPELDELSEES